MFKLVTLVVYLVALASSSEVLADGYRQGDWSGHMWSGGMIFGPLMMFGFFALFVFGIILLVKWLFGHGPISSSSSNSNNSAIEILKERYARGEIDKDEYEERKSVLE